ncbi:hypothetical protein K523DRAFT_378063 [Schizophyllum commune Tattone D]|nr:hypothetical protein K523DRAFT_378063 [Schizophyllum commune Tattone D]
MVKQLTNKQRAVSGDPARRYVKRHRLYGPCHTDVLSANALKHPARPTRTLLSCSSVPALMTLVEETSALPDLPTYDIEADDAEYVDMQPSDIARRVLRANRLRSLTLRGDNAQVKKRRQLAAVLGIMRAVHLQIFKYFRKGKSCVYLERKAFEFLMRGTEEANLWQVSLDTQFASKDALETYLTSTSAAHLEVLRIRTTTDVQSCVFEALTTGYRLAGLCTLTLRIKQLRLNELLDALEARYRDLGKRDRLCTVEVSVPLSAATTERADRLGMSFDHVPFRETKD